MDLSSQLESATVHPEYARHPAWARQEEVSHPGWWRHHPCSDQKLQRDEVSPRLHDTPSPTHDKHLVCLHKAGSGLTWLATDNHLVVSAAILKGLKKKGIVHPTPIQIQGIPTV